jgi:hypothetical protein
MTAKTKGVGIEVKGGTSVVVSVGGSEGFGVGVGAFSMNGRWVCSLSVEVARTGGTSVAVWDDGVEGEQAARQEKSRARRKESEVVKKRGRGRGFIIVNGVDFELHTSLYLLSPVTASVTQSGNDF